MPVVPTLRISPVPASRRSIHTGWWLPRVATVSDPMSMRGKDGGSTNTESRLLGWGTKVLRSRILTTGPAVAMSRV